MVHLPPVLLGLLAAVVPRQTSEKIVLDGGLSSALGSAEDVTGQGLAFVALEAARDTYLLREPFTLHITFGFDAGFLRTSAVQPFQRALDVPAQVQAAWLEAPEGALALEPEAGPGTATFALGDRVVGASPLPAREIGGRAFTVFELERRFLPTRTGRLELAAPLLRFAYATRFEDDFVQGRRALDRRDVYVRGEALALSVVPLPEEGRPADFSGAIGRFTIRAGAEPRELEEGESLELSVVVEGEGDLSQCAPPDLSLLDGFHVQGSLVERGEGRLSVTYGLAPGPSVRAVPPIRFAFFDTAPPAGYRSVESEPIPLVVRARRTERREEPDGEGTAPRWPVPVALGLLALVALLLALRARHRAAR